MNNKRYIVVGDHLTGENGLPYFVEPLELCRLYKVDPSQAILVNRPPPHLPDHYSQAS